MIRSPLRSLFLTVTVAGGLCAQDAARPLPTGPVPVVKAAVPAQSGQIGGGAVTVDLSNHLALDTDRTTFVRFDMTFGKLDVEMLPDFAPLNAANFLSYVDAQRYDDTVIHRTDNFNATTDSLRDIVQGGSQRNDGTLSNVATFAPVVLEHNYPNARGTLAAARTNEPNSATSGWYFNNENNSETLGPNTNNGNTGYTVFARVVGSGMEVVDTVALVNTFSVAFDGVGYATMPLRFYSGGVPTTANFVKVFKVYRVPLYPTANDTEAVLRFSATSSAPAVVQAAVQGSSLVLTPVQAGNATITVAAETVSGDRIETSFAFETGGLFISAQPQSRTVAPGAAATFSVTATAAAGTTAYQWYFHRAGMEAPQAIAGATAATYTDNDVQAADMGAYFVRLTNGTQVLDSAAALLTTTGGTSRLANLSTRGRIGVGGAITPGFVLSGAGNKELLIRAVGPTLAAEPFNLAGMISDPLMEVVPLGASAAVAAGDNWGDEANAAAIRSTAVSVGAFTLVEASADAALLTALPLPSAVPGYGYSVRVKNQNATQAGLAIAEVYDTDLSSPQRLVNLSALGFSGTGADALVPGFVIAGGGAKTMLIRAVGPTLTDYEVTGVMADPRLRVLPAGQGFSVAGNDNWGGTAELKTAFATVGAFDLRADDSLDAAVLVRLPPGAYTVVVEGAANSTGTVLVEAYEVD